jgi:hypothetical protein
MSMVHAHYTVNPRSLVTPKKIGNNQLAEKSSKLILSRNDRFVQKDIEHPFFDLLPRVSEHVHFCFQMKIGSSSQSNITLLM